MSAFHLGSVADPIIAGNDLDLEIAATTQSGTVLDLSGASVLRYALFAMQGDLPVNTPTLTLDIAGGVTITAGSLGQAQVALTNSHTSLLTGRDWHVLRYQGALGYLDIFQGLVVSTRGLQF